MYVRPLAAARDQGWSLIVFHDKAVTGAMNLELVLVVAPPVPAARQPWEPKEPFYRLDLAELEAKDGWAAAGQEPLAAGADAGQAWATFKWAYLTLLVSAGLFLLITQRDAVQPWIGYVTGLLTTIGTASKLFSSVLGPRRTFEG
jgi:hypothetical protein